MEMLDDMAPHEVDAYWMRQVCDNSAAAFEHIVARHQAGIMNFFRRYGVYSDVEDLTQKTFLRLWRYRNRYRPSAKLTTFLYRLARQVRIDELRRHQRWERFRFRLERESATCQAESVRRDAEGMDVDSALRHLSAAMREVVILGVYQQMPYAEIAEILGVPLGTVKSRMYHALKKLRARLEGEPHEE